MLSKAKFFAVALSAVLTLSSCTIFEPSVTNARELKKQLDDREVACEEFEVTADSETGGELLTCRDGSARNEGFFFLVWTSTEERDQALSEFCFNLKRRANAEEAFIAGSTWIGYSASTYIPTSLLADELGEKVLSGESFCSDRGLEIAEALSDEGVDICKSINVISKDLRRVSIERAQKYQLRIGDMMTGSGSLVFTEVKLREALHNLKQIADVPEELLVIIESIEPTAISKAAKAFDNGTSPQYLFMEFIGGSTYEEKWDSVMPQITEHNRRVALFELAQSALLINTATLLDTCAEYAPIDW